MTRKLFGFVVLFCYSSTAVAGSPQNLIKNPSFEESDGMFLTGYNKSDDLNNPGTYAIGGNPNQFNSNWSSNIQPHSGDFMMIVNGSTEPYTIVWDSGPITVSPHKAYFFSAYVTSLFSASPPVLIFRINGVEVGQYAPTSDSVGNWKQFNTVWNSGNQARFDISIVDENTEAFGNDFALDDISLADSPFYIVAPRVITMNYLENWPTNLRSDKDYASVYLTHFRLIQFYNLAFRTASNSRCN